MPMLRAKTLRRAGTSPLAPIAAAGTGDIVMVDIPELRTRRPDEKGPNTSRRKALDLYEGSR